MSLIEYYLENINIIKVESIKFENTQQSRNYTGSEYTFTYNCVYTTHNKFYGKILLNKEEENKLIKRADKNKNIIVKTLNTILKIEDISIDMEDIIFNSRDDYSINKIISFAAKTVKEERYYL